MSDYGKNKIEAADEHQKRFDPEGFKKRKEHEAKLRDFVYFPKCPECGGSMNRIRDSYVSLAATGTCSECGFEGYV